MIRFFKNIYSKLTPWHAVVFVLISTVLIIWCNYFIENTTKDLVSENVRDLPKTRVALVLGTSSKRVNGDPNLYFTYRMQAAFNLYRFHRVKKFILSGDNSKDYYNEPKTMKKALIKMGIPDSILVLDYAGLRTFDSMIRAKEIFGLDSVIVVSQRFHNERAVFIARKNGLCAFGYNAFDVEYQNQLKVKLREVFAKVKCFLDVYVLNTKPKYLGKKIAI